jgi:tripartite-type tricarboxylate transporter receptor subunit TctC
MSSSLKKLMAAIIAIGAMQSQGFASTSEIENFYRARGLSIIVGFSAGGGFDLYARLLSRHIGKYLPGNPRVVVQNMPGAGSVTAALNILDVAPKDGSVMGHFGRTVAVTPLMSDRKFDGMRFSWIGSITDEVSVCISSAKSNVKTWQDMLDRTFVVGGEGHESDLDINANLLKNLFGAKIRLVTGYPGTNEIKPAIERGEVDGVCGLSYSTLRARYAQELRDKQINVLVQVSLKKNPALGDVPFVGYFAKSEHAPALQLLLEPQEMARPFAAPPGIPPERLAALRAAFDATMKDSDFLSEANKLRLEVNPMKGEDIAKLVAGLYALPKDAGDKARRAMGLE